MTVVQAQAIGSGLAHRCVRLNIVPCRPYRLSRTTLVLKQQSSGRNLSSHAYSSIPCGQVPAAQQRHALKRRNFGPKRCRPTAEATSQSSSASVYKEESRPSNVYVAVGFCESLSPAWFTRLLHCILHILTCRLLQLSILAVVVCALANRVLYKMALVPLGNYVFFLAQLQTFGYVAVYFTVLYWRFRSVIKLNLLYQ